MYRRASILPRLLANHMTEFEQLNGIPETTGKEWMSLAYVQAVCAQARLNVCSWNFDNGIDLNVGSIRPTGCNEIANVFISLQLKSTASWKVEDGGYIKYDLPVENYRVLRLRSICPQYLVLFTLPSERTDWIKYQLEYETHKHVVELRHMAYYVSLKGKPETENKETIRVEIPTNNQLTAKALIGLYQDCAAAQAWATNQRSAG